MVTRVSKVMDRPTQVDVARLAGVSRATVSYVVNDVPDSRVPDETRQRVLDAIEELGYQPDARAQALRSGSTKTIALRIHSGSKSSVDRVSFILPDVFMIQSCALKRRPPR